MLMNVACLITLACMDLFSFSMSCVEWPLLLTHSLASVNCLVGSWIKISQSSCLNLESLRLGDKKLYVYPSILSFETIKLEKELEGIVFLLKDHIGSNRWRW